MQSTTIEQEENNRAWQATLDKRYDEAIELYTNNIVMRDRMTSYMNRGLTWLLKGDYERAEIDFRRGREHLDVSPARLTNLMVGAALWLCGKQEAACEDWANEIRLQKSGVITHTDSAGGVEAPALLWWASAHKQLFSWRPIAEEQLKNRSKTKKCQRSLWPGTLAPFLLGRVEHNILLQAAIESTTSLILQERHLLCAHFYIGAACLGNDNISGYRDHLARCAMYEDILRVEYYLARHEMNKYQTVVQVA